MQIVLYFDEPTIGYCPDCDVLAVYRNDKGLVCPKCHTTEISVFTWDGNSRHPEEDDTEEDDTEEDDTEEDDW